MRYFTYTMVVLKLTLILIGMVILSDGVKFPRFCGKNEAQSRIIGGSQSADGAWPWMASLQLGYSHYCGGAIIHSRLIITAAHCIVPLSSYNLQRLNVVVGSVDLRSSRARRIRIADILYHSDYEDEIKKHDIALIKLATRLTLKKEVRSNGHVVPICLPAMNQGFTRNDDCFVVGWGTTKYGTNNVQRILREVNVPILTDYTCQRKYGGIVQTHLQLCAGHDGGNKDSCQGDSGGPLLCRAEGFDDRWYLAGIVSWGRDCGNGGVYTKVSSYLKWILQSAKNMKV
ncbi:hypothetical protein SNEBB_010361 [Seison nebaliae]|nr:hypothetical protein SNEBB_010361 [Seison nebaliae]